MPLFGRRQRGASTARRVCHDGVSESRVADSAPIRTKKVSHVHGARPTMMHHIGPELRKGIHTYKYSGVDDSLVSKYILGPYWNWLVGLFPLWIAPNTITLSGLLLVVGNVISLLFLDPTLDNATSLRIGSFVQKSAELPVVSILPHAGLPVELERNVVPATESVIPPWLLIVWGLCLFMYQSLDSIDGKQARRTGMAGPLGELFDHGCDALNTILENLLVSEAMGLGRSYWSILSLAAAMANFYLTTWEEAHTHTLYLSAFSGPVEGILMVCTMYCFAGIFGGPSFYLQGVFNATGLSKVPYVRENLAWANWPVSDILVSLAIAGLIGNALASYGNVYKACVREKRSVFKPLLGLIPFVVLTTSNVAWMLGNQSQLFVQGPLFVPFLIFWGLSFAYLVGLVIISHVCKGPFPYWNWIFVPSILGAVDAHLPQSILQNSAIATQWTVYGALLLSSAVYAYFVYDVISTITEETGKPCFTVVSKDRKD